MAGRLAWIAAGGAAIIGGMAMQDRVSFGFGDEPERKVERKVDAVVDRIVSEQTDKAVIVDKDGKRLEGNPETERALAEAVGDLVKAEAQLVTMRIGKDAPADEMAAAEKRRDEARRRVDSLKGELERQAGREAAPTDRDRMRRQIQNDIRAALRG